MRIRKGHRLPAADRSSSHEGFLKHARVADGGNRAVNRIVKPMVAACISSGDAPVATSHQDLEPVNGTLDAGTERVEVDQERKRLSGDGYSRRRPQISDGVGLSISSIIQAGKGSPRSISPSDPASAESVVTSDTSVAKGVTDSRTDCSPSVAMEALDQPTLLLQSLKRVCTAAGNAGLTAKEAVAKMTEQGLPGLNEGGERLIVQVAKAFRGSSLFVEERGRYFMQESPSLKDYGVSSDTGNSSSRHESSASEIETAIEAARQLQNLQRISEGVGDYIVFKGRKGRAAADHRVGTSRSKSGSMSGAKASSSLRKQSGPRCNRDDGKGWRCFQPAESGFSLCKYHRDQIRRAEIRRRRSKIKSKEQSPPLKEVVKAVRIPEADVVKTLDANSVESDNELPDQKRRRGVKAKSLKSIL